MTSTTENLIKTISCLINSKNHRTILGAAQSTLVKRSKRFLKPNCSMPSFGVTFMFETYKAARDSMGLETDETIDNIYIQSSMELEKKKKEYSYKVLSSVFNFEDKDGSKVNISYIIKNNAIRNVEFKLKSSNNEEETLAEFDNINQFKIKPEFCK